MNFAALLSSKTVWAGIIGLVVTILQLFHHGVNIDAANMDTLEQTLVDLAGGVASFAAIVGRIVAKTSVSGAALPPAA